MEKKYRCPMCEDFETDSKEYLEYHWTHEGECVGCPCEICRDDEDHIERSNN